MTQIIMLDIAPSNGGQIQVRCAFWFPVPPEQALSLPNVSQSEWSGATPEQIDEIKAGTVVEEVHIHSFPTAAIATQVQEMLLSLYTAREDFLAQIPFKGELYGSRYVDGAWVSK